MLRLEPYSQGLNVRTPLESDCTVLIESGKSPLISLRSIASGIPSAMPDLRHRNLHSTTHNSKTSFPCLTLNFRLRQYGIVKYLFQLCSIPKQRHSRSAHDGRRLELERVLQANSRCGPHDGPCEEYLRGTQTVIPEKHHHYIVPRSENRLMPRLVGLLANFFHIPMLTNPLRDQLEAQLSSLRRQGVISSWYDSLTAVGENFGAAIDGRRRAKPRIRQETILSYTGAPCARAIKTNVQCFWTSIG